MLLSAFIGGGDAEKTHGGVGVSWLCRLDLDDSRWHYSLPAVRDRFFALFDHLQDSAQRPSLSSQCVLIDPELQRLLHRQLSVDAPLRDRQPLFEHDLKRRPRRVGGRTLLAGTALRVSAMAFLEPASSR